MKYKATPAARRLARERGLNLSDVVGTGISGCIKAQDILRFKKGLSFTPVAKAMLEYYKLPFSSDDFSAYRKIRKSDIIKLEASKRNRESIATQPTKSKPKGKPVTGMRKVIAQKMSLSVKTAPQYTLFADMDMSNVISMYKGLSPVMQGKTGIKLTITDILIKIVAAALERVPIINSSMVNDEIIIHEQINVGIAVALEDGLIVPVVRDANQKNLQQIIKERQSSVTKARSGKLAPDDYNGGTFTISNLGMYPVDYCTPIINQPESGILGVGRTGDKVVSVDGKIEIRPICGFSLTLDHRHIDGAAGANYLAELIELINNPYQILV